MQLVINVPEKMLKTISKGTVGSYYTVYDVVDIIQNGTPLPKGHGRIGDLDALEQEMIGGIKAGNHEDGYANYPNINGVDDCVDCVRYADAIIEADKEDKEENLERD